MYSGQLAVVKLDVEYELVLISYADIRYTSISGINRIQVERKKITYKPKC